MYQFRIPKAIENRLEELDKLCTEHPIEIPAAKVARFLGCNYDGLCIGIEKGTVPFGISWRKDKTVTNGKMTAVVDGRRETNISTLAFYNWITGGFKNA